MSFARAVLVGATLVLVAGCSGGGAPDREPVASPTVVTTKAPFGIDVPAGTSGSMVAARDGELVSCAGWGASDRAAGTAAGCDTVYDIGSITKQFTAAAVLTLEGDGRLRVTDRIDTYFDGVPPDKRAITIEHLLTHTSGLVDVLGGDYEAVSRSDLETAALGSALVSAPGEAYLYSNVGYSLLAAIIERVSGVDYEVYLARSLFEPAGMTSTGYVLPDWERSTIAIEYDAAGASHGRPNEQPWAADGPYWNLRGNGGLLSTPRDIFRWHLALEGDRILDHDAKVELFAPRVREEPRGDTFAAFGWVTQETSVGRLLWHNGGNGLSYAELARIPDAELMVFWVTNAVRGREPAWNLEKRGQQITEGMVGRLLAASDQ
ncbi:beta-lactamase family protein [Nocardioides humilatus]|uniref:Beta-lactamase family protein n=1 Tax=Nocardioides humilatus TaxID=2607660 RepID=A0A5B1LJ85_9ACTN|nr:serine hydrolase domain-containing protein [Nocardioides humilatus]KAA1420782.1 beta-lactamase family protein [Nocardioides humilatus]